MPGLWCPVRSTRRAAQRAGFAQWEPSSALDEHVALVALQAAIGTVIVGAMLFRSALQLFSVGVHMALLMPNAAQ